MENSIINQNTNCGLDALSSIVSLKGVSFRTLLNIAEDNGVSMYPAKLNSNEDFRNIPYPAIIHSDNHFEYAESFSDVDLESATGNVIISDNSGKYKTPEDLSEIKGESWVAAGTAAVSLGVSAYKGYKGKKQKEKARDEMKKLVKPTYSIPREIFDNLSDAEKRTVEGLPAQQKQEFVKNLERTQATRFKSATDRKSGLLGLQAQTSATNDAYTNLVSKDALMKTQSKQRKEAEIAQARMNMAAHRDKAFAISRGDYDAKLNSLQADYQAGARNQNAAEQSALNTAISAGGAMAGGMGQGGQGGQGGSVFGGGNSMAGGIGSGGSSGGGINYNFGQTQQGGFGFN